MTRALCLVLVLALPASAQERLVPSADLEERRAPIEALRGKALALRLTASVSYAVAGMWLGWTIAEAIAAAGSRRAAPLTGGPYHTVIPALWTVIATILFGGIGATLHLTSRSYYQQADDDEMELDRELRERQKKDE